jgi:cell division protease FtsH
MFWFFIILTVMFALVFTNNDSPDGEELDFSTFMAKVEEGNVRDVTIRGQTITGTFTNDTTFEAIGPVFQEPLYKDLIEHNIIPNFEPLEDESVWVTGFFTFVPLVVMVLLFLWFMRGLQGQNGRAMSFGKSRAKLMEEHEKKVTFGDVAGIDESKEELSEIVDFLKDPSKFTKLGGRIPSGVLLMGSPGTGKTLLARAVAGEADVPFFSISGSDFVEMFVGVGASRVRDLFEQGKENAPCIIFIDEIDAVGRHRGAGLGGGHDEREQTLNQLLVEMDGFEGTEGVILIAATNRPDVLDPALLRPGRFDRRVVVPNPDVKGRELILKIHAKKILTDDDIDLSIIAKTTPGLTGADLQNLCNEAALLAARGDKETVGALEFELAREKIFMGPERKSMVVPEGEKKNTAYHEAGHAIVAHLLPGHDPVHKITIVPRGRALGLTWTLPDEDRLSVDTLSLRKQIAMLMGGRAAEEVALNIVTGGAKNDIERATKIAHSMVCELGMSETLGPVAWGEEQGEVFLGRQMSRTQTFSESTAQQIDVEIRATVVRGYQLAKSILSSNMTLLQAVAEKLIEIETLDQEQFVAIMDSIAPVLPEELSWVTT